MKKMKIMAIALTMVAAFAMSAVAADWNFYGSARVSTFMTDTTNTDTTITDGNTLNISEELQGNARIGAKVTVSDELSGRFEYGASDGNANVRLLYGVWNFGPGSLLIGKDYTPVWLSVSNQVYAVDNGLGGWGENYSPRLAQLKLQFGGFQIALVEPNVKYYDTKLTGGVAVDDEDAVIDDDVEVKLPGIQAKYRLDLDNWYVAVSGAYNTFEIGTTNGQDVDSYMAAAAAGVTFGAASVKGSVFTGTNVGNIALTDVTGDNSGKGYARYDGTTVTDVDSIGFALVAAYTLSDMFAMEAGVGYVENDTDDVLVADNDVVSYYVQAPVTLAPGVFVIPEIGVIDYKNAGEDDVLYYGAKWQINF